MNLRLAFLIFANSATPLCLADAAEMLEPDEPFAETAHKTGSYTQRTTLVSLVGEAQARSISGRQEPCCQSSHSTAHQTGPCARQRDSRTITTHAIIAIGLH